MQIISGERDKLYRISYISYHVLLNSLNELERDKM